VLTCSFLSVALTVQGNVNRCPRAAWQVTALAAPLETLLSLSRKSGLPGFHVTLCSGSLLSQLAGWIIMALRGLLQGSADDVVIDDPEVSQLS